MSRLTTVLLRAGLVAGPLFLTTALVEGGIRPGYRPLRHPVSSLALGKRGAVQTSNFLVTGALYTAFAAGLQRCDPGRRRVGAVPVLVGSAAIGLLGAGTFRSDPVSGYPPGTSDQLTKPSIRGILHDLLSMPTFFALPAAAMVEARGAYRRGCRMWAVYSAISAVVQFVAFVMASAGFAQQRRLVDRAGLAQRTSIGTGFGWLTALAVRRLRFGTSPG